MVDGREILKGAVASIEADDAGRSTRRSSARPGRAADQGMTPLAVCEDKKTLGVVLLKDVVKPGIPDRLASFA